MLNKDAGVANRATFVVDKDGKNHLHRGGQYGHRPDRRDGCVQPVGAQSGQKLEVSRPSPGADLGQFQPQAASRISRIPANPSSVI